MKAIIELEAIGDNLRRIHKGLCSDNFETANSFAKAIPRSGKLRSYAMSPPKQPWVAKLTGIDARYGFRREFITPTRDYAYANGTGSRGIMLYFLVDEGEIYEVHALRSWKRQERYFCRIVDGEEVRINREEVDQWLRERYVSE